MDKIDIQRARADRIHTMIGRGEPLTPEQIQEVEAHFQDMETTVNAQEFPGMEDARVLSCDGLLLRIDPDTLRVSVASANATPSVLPVEVAEMLALTMESSSGKPTRAVGLKQGLIEALNRQRREFAERMGAQDIAASALARAASTTTA